MVVSLEEIITITIIQGIYSQIAITTITVYFRIIITTYQPAISLRITI